MTLLRLLVADDHRAFLDAIAMRLAVEPDLEVVGTAATRAEALRLAEEFRVDVALLDVRLGDADGIALGAELRARVPGIRLVAVTGAYDVERAVDAVRLGFSAWVLKDSSVADLVDIVRGVARGETRIPAHLLTPLLRRLLEDEQKREEGRQVLATLTPREREVLACLAEGLGRDAVAQRLFLSPNTVRTHIQSILAKLGVHSSLAAVALARRSGLV